MNTSQFTSRVKKILIKSIAFNPNNPRGPFDTTKDPSFDRLASSIKQMDVLVPIVVRELSRPRGSIRYELVDGERRYWAAKKVGRRRIPAHVLSTDSAPRELRKVMFHLHMTREQWEPWAQCKALAEIYPKLDRGIPVGKKEEWARKIRKETVMNAQTAKDRVRVLSWPKSLRNRIDQFVKENPRHDIYSYVLAIEASVIEPSLQGFPDYYATPSEEKVNEVRRNLLKKMLQGIQSGTIDTREVIRSVEPLFSRRLSDESKREAKKIFRSLVHSPEYRYQDARADIDLRIPEVSVEKPPRLRKLISQIKSLKEALDKYKPAYVERAAKRQSTRIRLKTELITALKGLAKATGRLLKKL